MGGASSEYIQLVFMEKQTKSSFTYCKIRTLIMLLQLFDCVFQIDWLNNYHEKCREIVGAELKRQGKKEALEYLMRESKMIG